MNPGSETSTCIRVWGRCNDIFTKDELFNPITKVFVEQPLALPTQPSECGRQHTLISVHAQTAAWQQSYGNSEARMSKKYGEWRDYTIHTVWEVRGRENHSK